MSFSFCGLEKEKFVNKVDGFTPRVTTQKKGGNTRNSPWTSVPKSLFVPTSYRD